MRVGMASLCCCTLGAWMLAASGAALGAEAFPARPLRVIVPFPAGGATDILGRAVAQKLVEHLGRTVVIENVGGASTMIGAERAARATPDGYTLLMATSTTFSTNPHLYRKMTYTLDDFIAVSLFAKSPLAMSASPSLPVKTLADFISYAKARPDQLNYGTTGRGGNAHLTGAMIASVLGVRMQDVPYKGSAPALVDLMGGSLTLHIDQVSTSLPLYKAGKINVLAITGEQRAELAPEVPTFAESGFPKVVVNTLIGAFVPAATPRPVVDILNAAVRAALQSEEIRSRFRPFGTFTEWTTPERAMALFRADYDRAGSIIRTMNIELQ